MPCCSRRFDVTGLVSPMRTMRGLPGRQGSGRGGGAWSPGSLGPYAWYDAELGQPKDVGYVQLDGASGDYIYTSDSAVLSFSNDIEVVMRVLATDWTAAASQTLCGKYVTTGNQRSWRFYVSTAGAIALTASANGTAVTSVTVTPTVAFTDGAWIWLRLRLDLTNGSNSVGTVDVAADTGSNYLEPVSWTANGSATGATIAGLFDSTSPLEIGSFQSGTSERFTGRVGRMILRAGFAGSTVADFNASGCYLDGCTDSAGNVWQVGNAKVYDTSGNARSPVVNGAGSNAAAPLPWKGESVVTLHTGADEIDAAGSAVDAFRTANGDFSVRVDWVPTDGSYINLNDGNGWIFYASGGAIVSVMYDPGYVAGAIVAATLGQRMQIWLSVVKTGPATCTHAIYTRAPGLPLTDNTGWTLAVGPSAVAAYNQPTTSVPMVFRNYNGTRTDVYGMAAWTNATGTGAPSVELTPSAMGQSGYTTASYYWSLVRGTAGRKAVVQSAVAASARSAFLLGTDDAATSSVMPPAGAADSWTLVFVGRIYATPTNFGRAFDNRNGAGSGLSILNLGTANSLYVSLSDGTTTVDTSSVAPAYTAGQRVVFAVAVNGTTNLVTYTNGAATTPVSTAAVTGTRTGSLSPAYIGRGSAGNYTDAEWEALLLFDRVLTAGEVAQLVSYYRGGI